MTTPCTTFSIRVAGAKGSSNPDAPLRDLGGPLFPQQSDSLTRAVDMLQLMLLLWIMPLFMTYDVGCCNLCWWYCCDCCVLSLPMYGANLLFVVVVCGVPCSVFCINCLDVSCCVCGGLVANEFHPWGLLKCNQKEEGCSHKRLASLDERNIHSSPSLAPPSSLTTCCMARPTKPDPPVTSTLIGTLSLAWQLI